MWRVALGLLALLNFTARAETVRVATWNLQWFPSGSDKPVAREVESANIAKAAAVITIANPDVILIQEVRDWETCQLLAEALLPTKYEVLICSAFKDEFSGGMGKQQVAILAKRSAEAAWAERWKSSGAVDPPRGFAFAVIRLAKVDVGFYSLHLKSNLVFTGGEKAVQMNIRKREISVEQVLAHQQNVSRDFPRLLKWVVGGDFNTNRDQAMFVSESTLDTFEKAEFIDPLASLPLVERITHPGKGRYPDATFDYLLGKGLGVKGAPEILKSQASDHSLVTVEFEVP